jgi:formylglycine-generating enzyme required for sulfatase activity
MRLRAPHALAPGLALVLCACAVGQTNPGFDADGDAGTGTATSGNVPASSDASTPVPDGGGAKDARTDGPKPGCLCTQGCGSCPNVAQVPAGSFRIDSVEATNLHYAAFLASGPSAQYLPAACAKKTSFVPADGWPAPAGRETHPVTNVDWCDAYAYCRWTGKHLCGRIGGGTNAFADYNDPTKDEWFAACSNAGARAYPYGAQYQASACNGADKLLGGTAASGATSTCVGGYGSLFDMSGNVWEWEDTCAGDGETQACKIRGGAYDSGGNQLACGADASLPRDQWGPNVGIRCCSN